MNPRCQYCGHAMRPVEGKTCDGCWELKRRIEDDPEMAAKFLQEVLKKG